jgi:EpsI family protein
VTAERRLLLFGALMFGAAVLAHAMRPTQAINAGAPPIDLATLVPQRFGDWQIDAGRMSIALPPELQEAQDLAYDKSLVRTYVDKSGERIMLNIAYGANQTRNLQVHRPEVCYAALGFQLLSLRKTSLAEMAGSGPIPVMQMVAAQSFRNEPVTYWIRVGDQVVRGNVELGLARLSYGLRGYIADGLLFRVSNVTSQNEAGFELQQRFVRDLLASLTPEKRRLLVGNLAR